MPFFHYLAMVYNRNLKRFTTIIYKFDLNGFHHLYLQCVDYLTSSANFYRWQVLKLKSYNATLCLSKKNLQVVESNLAFGL